MVKLQNLCYFTGIFNNIGVRFWYFTVRCFVLFFVKEKHLYCQPTLFCSSLFSSGEASTSWYRYCHWDICIADLLYVTHRYWRNKVQQRTTPCSALVKLQLLRFYCLSQLAFWHSGQPCVLLLLFFHHNHLSSFSNTIIFYTRSSYQVHLV